MLSDYVIKLELVPMNWGVSVSGEFKFYQPFNELKRYVLEVGFIHDSVMTEFKNREVWGKPFSYNEPIDLLFLELTGEGLFLNSHEMLDVKSLTGESLRSKELLVPKDYDMGGVCLPISYNSSFLHGPSELRIILERN